MIQSSIILINAIYLLIKYLHTELFVWARPNSYELYECSDFIPDSKIQSIIELIIFLALIKINFNYLKSYKKILIECLSLCTRKMDKSK